MFEVSSIANFRYIFVFINLDLYQVWLAGSLT